jgi:hypothetical protein
MTPAVAFNAPAGNAGAEMIRSELFFCVKKKVRRAVQKTLLLRPFEPALEVVQVLQIAGLVSRSKNAAQPNDWKPQRGFSTHAPN